MDEYNRCPACYGYSPHSELCSKCYEENVAKPNREYEKYLDSLSATQKVCRKLQGIVARAINNH